MNIQITLLFITASINCLLSLFVLFGKRDRTNIVYSLFVLFASLWAVGLAFFILENDLSRALYVANFYYVAAAGIPAFFLYFSMIFLNKSDSMSNWMKFLIVLPLILIGAAFIFDSAFIIKKVISVEWGKDVILNKLNYFIYAAYFIAFVFLAYMKLLETYTSTKEKEERSQLKFIIWGTSIGFLFGMIFNLFLPSLGNYKYIYLGPIFSFSMVASIAYSITKHHLFDIKVIATEILTFALWIFLFIRTMVSSSLEDQIINSSLLVVTVIVGIFLIRSVLKEVRQREQIEKLANELKEANQGQASLMHFMNHQIKGRFGNIKNIFAELETGDYGTMPEETIPLLAKGLDEANIGVNYVQGILKGASAEKGTLPYDMRPIDLRPIVESVVENQRDHAEKKALKLTLSVEPGVYSMTGDSLQLSEAIRNLVDNSLNYTEKGSVAVTLSEGNHIIRIKVKDTGIGINPEDRPNLFKAGGRGVDSLKVNVNATGYGLVFVRSVVEAHRGKVWLESEGVGKGSTFYIELPKV